jgi:hypothetical protein
MRPLVLAAALLVGSAGAAPVEVLVQTPAGTPPRGWQSSSGAANSSRG